MKLHYVGDCFINEKHFNKKSFYCHLRCKDFKNVKTDKNNNIHFSISPRKHPSPYTGATHSIYLNTLFYNNTIDNFSQIDLKIDKEKLLSNADRHGISMISILEKDNNNYYVLQNDFSHRSALKDILFYLSKQNDMHLQPMLINKFPFLSDQNLLGYVEKYHSNNKILIDKVKQNYNNHINIIGYGKSKDIQSILTSKDKVQVGTLFNNESIDKTSGEVKSYQNIYIDKSILYSLPVDRYGDYTLSAQKTQNNKNQHVLVHVGQLKDNYCQYLIKLKKEKLDSLVFDDNIKLAGIFKEEKSIFPDNSNIIIIADTKYTSSDNKPKIVGRSWSKEYLHDIQVSNDYSYILNQDIDNNGYDGLGVTSKGLHIATSKISNKIDTDNHKFNNYYLKDGYVYHDKPTFSILPQDKIPFKDYLEIEQAGTKDCILFRRFNLHKLEGQEKKTLNDFQIKLKNTKTKDDHSLNL